MNLTTQEYMDAILNANLDPKEIEILKTLYKFPNSTADVKELAEALDSKWQGFALRIGTIGKKFSDYLGRYPDNYKQDGLEKPAYFLFIGPYYQRERKTKSDKNGWEMNDNLREALENLKLV